MARILLVDDNAELLAIMTLSLQEENHVTTLAANGREAMALIASQPFDLIITDLVMPEKEGLEIISEIRKKHPGLKVIAMSGGGSSFDGRQMLRIAQKLGASQTLEKPFTKTALIAVVDAALNISQE